MAVKTIILCGGHGTRIRGVADNVPKPMIPIGDRPILWHIMKTYAYFGINDFVLCLGFQGSAIKQYFLDYQYLMSDVTLTLGIENNIKIHNGHPEQGWRVTLAETGLHTQTGARIRQVKKYLENTDIFCISYGDGLADIEIDKLIKFHRSHGKIGTVTGVRPQGRFGVMTTETVSKVKVVTEFKEKPQATEGFINGGFFVFDHRLWDYLPDHPDLVFEHQPLGQLAKDDQLVMYEHNGFWQPMDTYREWKLLNDLWEDGEASWKRWEN